MTCYHCGAKVDNGLALCDLCQRKARLALEYLPVYFHNLARWRPGRVGSRPVPGSRVLYDGGISKAGTGDRISDALDETSNMLTTWTRATVNARPYLTRLYDRLALARYEERIDEAQMVGWLCRGFDRHLTSVATLEWCGEFVRDLDHHEAKLRSFTEELVPGWYAGACSHCGARTYVIPGLTWVACGSCGVTTYARDHLDVVLAEARDWVAPPRRIAEALVALLDTEQSIPRLYERIKKWQQRDRVVGIWRTERTYTWDDDQGRVVLTVEAVGFPRYRLGDVLDVLLIEGATRLTVTSATTAS